MNNSFDCEKRGSKKFYKRLLSFILDLVPYFLILLAVRFRKQLALFQYWRPVSVVVLAGLVLYFVWLFRFVIQRRNLSYRKNPKLYDLVFYRKWVPTFIAQILIGISALTVTAYGLAVCMREKMFLDLWWPIIIFLFVLVIIFGSLSFYFVVSRRVEVGVCRSGIFVTCDFFSWNDIENIFLDKNKKCIVMTCTPSENVSFVNGEPIAISYDIKIKSSSISGSLEKLYGLLRKYQESFLKD